MTTFDEITPEKLEELELCIKEMSHVLEELQMQNVSEEWMFKVGLPKARMMLEKTIDILLLTAKNKDTTIQTIKDYIYNESGGRVGQYVKWFIELFDIDGMVEEIKSRKPEEILQTFVGLANMAWNWYPHKELADKTPFELFISGEKAPNVDLDEKSRPQFESVLYEVIEAGYLSETTPGQIREQILNEDGSPEAFSTFCTWLLSLFKIKLNKKQKEIADYIALKAWRNYPHKVLGNKSPVRLKIEATKHCEAEGCKEETDLYICDECETILCFPDTGVHVLKKKHSCRKIELRPKGVKT